MVPNRTGALIIESIEDWYDFAGVEHLRSDRVASEIHKEHCSVDCNVAGLHNSREHPLAERASVGVHPTRLCGQI